VVVEQFADAVSNMLGMEFAHNQYGVDAGLPTTQYFTGLTQ